MNNEINNLYEFGNFKFEVKTNTLWRDKERISLSPKAVELLKLLIEKHGEVVSKQEIFDTIWSETFVEEGVLTQNIYTLRQALGVDENGKQLIENFARRGYRLTIPVQITLVPDTPPKANRNNDLPDTEKFPTETKAARARPVKYLLPLSLSLALIAVAVFLGYRFLFPAGTESVKNPLTDMKFKQLTDTGDVSYLTISPDGNLVAYTRGFDIILRNLQTNSEIKLNIENSRKAGCLQFSPDAGAIYFGSAYNRDEKGNIFRVSPAGGVPVTVAEDVWSGFSISPSGKEIAFVRKFPDENKQNLIIKDLETGAEKILKTLKMPEEFYWNNYPAWSRDGKKLALVAVTQTEHFSRLLLFDPVTGNEQELKPKNFRNIEQVVWNFNETALIAAANDGNNFQIWKIPLAGDAPKRITNDLNSYLGISISQDKNILISRQRIYFSNIWVSKKGDLNNLKQLTSGTSRNDGLQGLTWVDEERIVYTTNDEKIRDWNLWLLNTTDGTRQKLTSDTDAQNDFPAVSPDRKTVFFASDRNKETRIWRINIDGSNLTQVTFGENENHQFPQISPDGKWLYFIIKGAKTSTIGRKSLQEKSVQELSGKTSFIPGSFLSLSPDGKLIAFQNIGNLAPANSENSTFQIAFLSTEDPQNVNMTNIEAWRQTVQWSENSKSFDYIGGNIKESSIWRQTFEKDAKPVKILDITETNIFNFAWSPGGQSLAVSRGKLLRDVVLISNFE